MSRTACSRICSILLLLALLGSPAFAYGSRSIRLAPEPTAFFTWLWQALGQLLPAINDSHAGMDPDGASVPEPGTESAESDSHAGMDPDGQP